MAEVYCRPNGEGAIDSWHATFLGLRHLPREVTAFEIEAFYQFSAEESRVIEERRRPELKLALASGSSVQSWLWSPPAKHSTRQIDEMIATATGRRGSAPAHRTYRSDPHRGHQPTRRFPLLRRALRGENPTLQRCRKNDRQRVLNGASSATVTRICRDQSTPYNQTLTIPPAEILGENSLPLPYVIARKTRGPQKVRI